jgi:dipeptidyl aminopeptidase/acylaminoacyl peptidase
VPLQEDKIMNRIQRRRTIAVLSILMLAAVAVGQQRNVADPEVQLRAASQKELLDGDLKGAIEIYEKISKGSNKAAAAKALVEMGRLYEKQGNADARHAYERVVREFGNQKETVAQAQARLKALGAASSVAIAYNSRTLIPIPFAPLFQSVSLDGRYIYMDHGIVFDQVIRQQKKIDETTDLIWDAAFSTDSKQVAYEVNRDAKDGPFEMRVVSLDAAGSGPGKVLFRNEEFIGGRPFGWSPDGKTVFAVLTRKDRTYVIAAISTANGSFQTIKSLEWRWPAGMSLSPDGRFYAYDASIAKESIDRDIFLLSTDGAIEVTLAQNPARDAGPVWTPDGNAVVFASDREGAPGLWMVEVADGKPRGVAVNLRKNELLRPLGFSADGTLYYSSDKASVFPGVYISPTGSVNLSASSGSPPTVATRHSLAWK